MCSIVCPDGAIAQPNSTQLNPSRASRYDKLKEDFKFNLGLIEDRDVELGRYEAAVQGLKESLRDKVRIQYVSVNLRYLCCCFCCCFCCCWWRLLLLLLLSQMLSVLSLEHLTARGWKTAFAGEHDHDHDFHFTRRFQITQAKPTRAIYP